MSGENILNDNNQRICINDFALSQTSPNMRNRLSFDKDVSKLAENLTPQYLRFERKNFQGRSLSGQTTREDSGQIHGGLSH